MPQSSSPITPPRTAKRMPAPSKIEVAARRGGCTMRPDRCVKGHELQWLSRHLAVCPDCDTETFIYHHEGYLSRLFHAIRRRALSHPAQQHTPHWRSTHGDALVYRYF